jgi:putative transposase
VRKRFSEEQIIGFLREAAAGLAVKDLFPRYGFSEDSYYLWRRKFGGMTVPTPNACRSWRQKMGS